ncbi:hypothetical protein Cni_G19491 [Canna indica]|uniref:Zinc knuckle CX2CX4HX4C domain-containing protein n=1 Tax=Canna indica TaxID=4628 RepID=A0AAQ3KNA4_9LILI|nr:hypothetical protein Cni_G19491 [Canna indica]
MVIGNSTGKFIKVDGEDGDLVDRFLRIRVSIDLSKSLRRGVMMPINIDKVKWIGFQYERPSLFCFACGKITHLERGCRRPKIDAEGNILKERFGSFMIAPLRRRAKTFSLTRATERRKKNTVWTLRKNDDLWTDNEIEMQEEVNNYFEELFKSSNPTSFDNAVMGISSKFSSEMNQRLNDQITKEEMKEALFEMHPTKALGSDGFPAVFFQKHWHLLGDEINSTLTQFLNGNLQNQDLNHTLIVLIPKVKDLERVSQFRPINLCNILYKIASNAITNRLKTILPEIIFGCRSTFVHGRSITDNVIMAHENIHHLHNKRQGNN